ncbi:MAG TPA: HEAT repeat domain-containing protein [Gemmataceae bacterium]|nr:HEAT repeat domain-containing protein [Gemmataceae bacterium]
MSPNRVSLLGAPFRCGMHRPSAGGLLLAAVFAGAALAQPPVEPPPPPGGPVAALQNILSQEAAADLAARRANLAKLIGAMDLGELSQVLLLEDWRTLETQVNDPLKPKAELARIQTDLQARSDAVQAFLTKGKAAMRAAREAPTGTRQERDVAMLQKAATIDLISETVSTARRLANLSQLTGPGGFGAQQSQISYLDQQLAGIPPDLGVTPDLISLLTESKNADVDPAAATLVRRSAARALGAIHRGQAAQVKDVVEALDKILADTKANGPELRLIAAQSLDQLSKAAAEEMQRSLNRDPNIRDCYLAFAQGIPNVIGHGLAPDQPVEVRRTCISAYTHLAAEMLDISIVPQKNEAPLLLDPKDPTEIQAYKDRQKQHFDRIQAVCADFSKNADYLAEAVGDEDPQVRASALTIVADLANVRDRLKNLAAHPAPQPVTEPGGAAPPPNGEGAKPEAIRNFAAGVILVAAEDTSPQQQQKQAYEDLARGLDKTLASVVRQLGAPDAASRLRAIDALEIQGVTAFPAVDAVTVSLGDPDRFVRWAAARTLGELAQTETDKQKFTPAQIAAAIQGFRALLRDEDVGVRLASVTALQHFGTRAAAAAPDLTAMIIRSQVPAALAIVAAADTDPELATGDPTVRIGAFRALEAINNDDTVRALPAVLSALSDKNSFVSVAAADFIGNVGPIAPQAQRSDLVRALHDILADPNTDSDVRRAAGAALLRLLPAKPK